MNRYNSNLYEKCRRYLDYVYSQPPVTRGPSHSFDWIRKMNPKDLEFNGYNETTKYWCLMYCLKHEKLHGIQRGGEVKQQSKRKNLRLRKVSKKY